MRFSVFIAVTIFPFIASWGQVDISSELLLMPQQDSYPKAPGLESGRYKMKRPTKTEPDSGNEMTIVLKKQKTLPKKKVPGAEVKMETVPLVAPVKASKPEQKKVEELLFSEPSPKPPGSEAPPENKEVVFEEPSVSEQVRDIVLGNNPEVVEAYKEQIHPDDIRLNRIEVDVLPGVVSTTSASSYSFRSYNTFSPKILLGANFWMTPFLGIYGSYTTTMGGDVVEDSSIKSRTTVQQEWTEIGLDVRKFFGMSRKSNSLEFGLHLSEYKFKVRGDSTHRAQLRSSGIGFHLMTRIPVAPSYSWIFGGKLVPRIQHAEMETGINLSSGSSGESSRVDLMLGGEFKLARQNQILWDITTSFEKNQFNGQANLVDPETGLAPQGVAVENTFVIFSLGYRWGQ